MAKAYLGLGTNLGDKEKNLRDAVQKIGERIGNVSSLSAFYATIPWGFQSENTFLNAVACVETTLPPHELLAIAQQIERETGRTTKPANHTYADRIIDIDLLMWENLIINTPNLTLPHPLMHKRRFVMEPFAEIAPDVSHPVLGETIYNLYQYILRHS
ncbi:MAG: 2-amino-4-hydroxy-6-hydroxymethyldihydropteridine diphosphokinase [Mediterranea sp.]|jgi:2-amino-4-hydroxy-6-hydroxymethyldihydropteridine diphosphokinase|nr:2-amino-4-hydroxy-6-hydroxymethyldihydropteridine diphosphokinase [Mediterranea sp.]